MSKYAPLYEFLAGRSDSQVPMSFAEVEKVLGFRLPNSARTWPAWWSNNQGTHVGVRAWRDAGWKASRIDLANEQVTFVRDHTPTRTNAYRWEGVDAEAQGGSQGEVNPGMSEAPREFDGIVVSLARLSRSALAMIDDLVEETGQDRGAAVLAMLEASAAERRRRMIEDLPVARMPPGHDSTALIREDRDSR